jgi:hypothetical protein
MQAHDRFLPEWFNRIRSRQITLPRFQRFIAWGHTEVSGLLTTVLRGLPSGAALILEVGDEEKFKSRTMTDAPDKGDKVTEQLLDGQQRLTALWRSLHDKYPDRTYLIGLEDDPHNGGSQQPYVYGQARWVKNGTRYPVWADSPTSCWQRGFIPLRLLRPEDIKDELDVWIEEAISPDASDKFAAYKELNGLISELRTKVREFNLPYLSLPARTEKDVALDVFVKMNTSSVRLDTYDIVVALVEGETGKSLHEHVDELNQAVPRVQAYADVPSVVLDMVALRQNRVPSQAGYRGIDFGKMIEDWAQVVAGIKGMVGFLEDESVFDAQRLPSYTAIPVIAALWEYLPQSPDQLGNARHLLRKYLWRAFLTGRYEQSSATNALQDYRALRDTLKGTPNVHIPIFNEDAYPVPTAEMILLADWPKRKAILSRGLLALQLKAGAEDPADGARASISTITTLEHPREYHHLFPDSKLSDADVPAEDIYRAVNCALITWRTNRTISNKDPIKYLKERADNSTLGEEELKRRLRTHLIPYDELNVGAYTGLEGEQLKQRTQADYQKFAQKRAALLAKAAVLASNGQALDLSQIFSETVT